MISASGFYVSWKGSLAESGFLAFCIRSFGSEVFSEIAFMVIITTIVICTVGVAILKKKIKTPMSKQVNRRIKYFVRNIDLVEMNFEVRRILLPPYLGIYLKIASNRCTKLGTLKK